MDAFDDLRIGVTRRVLLGEGMRGIGRIALGALLLGPRAAAGAGTLKK